MTAIEGTFFYLHFSYALKPLESILFLVRFVQRLERVEPLPASGGIEHNSARVHFQAHRQTRARYGE